jgi:uracil-DNA glycosylase
MELQETGRWAELLTVPGWEDLSRQVEAAYAAATVYPPREDLFAAFRLTPPERVRVIILGQDPYHGPNQAQGLSFSVPETTAIPKSLKNIYQELESDLGVTPPKTGCLKPWAEQGVFLLNSVLTVEAHQAGSHRKFGWEAFTDQVISATNQLEQPIAVVLWGNYAIKKQALIDGKGPRLVLTAPHPSPLSAYRGFFGSRPFSKINDFLTAQGQPPIRWV